VIKVGNLIRLGVVTCSAIPIRELVEMWILFSVTRNAIAVPTHLRQKPMVEPVHPEGSCGMAEVAALYLEGSVMGVLSKVTDRAGVGILELEHQFPLCPGPLLMTRRAGRDGVGPGELEPELHLVPSPVIVRWSPTFEAMAGIAAPIAELTPVSIQVTGSAALPDRPGIRSPHRALRKLDP